MQLTDRQETILHIVKGEGPITAQELAERLHLTRAALRTDLSLLTMTGFLDAKPRVGYYYTGGVDQTRLQVLLGRVKVERVQSVPVVVREKVSMYDAAITIFLEDVETFFIVDGNGLIKGMASSRELMKVMVGGGDVNQIPVSVAMERLDPAQALKKEMPIFLAIKAMQERGVEALPVLEGAKPVGQVTRKGLLGFFMEWVREKEGV